MQYLFSFDGDMGLEDGFYEAFAIFASAVWAVDIFAEAGDDVIVVDCCCDVGGGVFGDEFFVGGATKIALVAPAFVFRPGEPEILSADA